MGVPFSQVFPALSRARGVAVPDTDARTGFKPMRDLTSNNRFERSRGHIFVEPRRGSMIWINQLRSRATQPRVAQPHR
jgi:hypothetical protein